MKKFLSCVLIALGIMVFASNVLASPRTVEQVYDQDWIKSGYDSITELRQVSKKVVRKVNCGKIKHGKIPKRY